MHRKIKQMRTKSLFNLGWGDQTRQGFVKTSLGGLKRNLETPTFGGRFLKRGGGTLEAFWREKSDGCDVLGDKNIP